MSAVNAKQATPRGGATLAVEVVSLTGVIWSGDARRVALPGSAGRFGVMAGHTPLLTTLRDGMVKLELPAGNVLDIYVSGGFVEVQHAEATVIAELAAVSESIEQGRALVADVLKTSPMAQAFAGRNGHRAAEPSAPPGVEDAGPRDAHDGVEPPA